jgi:hypothetical protein
MSDMRESLNAALDSVAEEDETQNYDETPQVIDAAEETAEAETSEEEGSVSADIKSASETADDSGEAKPDGTSGDIDSGTDDVALKSEAGSGDSIKAPMDWGPQEREQWSKIPRNLQEKVMDREKELNSLMQSTVDARKTHSEFEQLSNRYGSVMSSIAGNTPMDRVSSLFDTVSNLRTGSNIQKAQIIADMISSFDVDINTLDSAIVGAAPSQQNQQQSDIERMISDRFAPFEQQLGQQNAYKQQQETQQQEAAVSEVQKFAETAEGEFLQDVRYDMADLIDMANARGQYPTLKEAYDKACILNPEIQATLKAREQTARLTGGRDTMANKRAAASSIVGNKGGVGGGSNSLSMRDTISDAWDSGNKI